MSREAIPFVFEETKTDRARSMLFNYGASYAMCPADVAAGPGAQDASCGVVLRPSRSGHTGRLRGFSHW